MFGMTSKKQNKEKQITTEEQNVQPQETAVNNESVQPEQEEVDEENKSHKKGHPKKDAKDEAIEELNAKLADLSDKHLRLQAEFDNFRKRTIKEKADLIKSGGESVLVNILPVVDDFERALNSLKDIPETDAGKQGTQLIYNKFSEFLKQNNVKEIEAVNQEFNVDLHEAITKIPAPAEELKGKVVAVVEKGYVLNDKVIRFAKVVIGE
jgi:molecular chaperone GrpE